MWFIKHIKTGEVLNITQEKTSIGRLGTTYCLKNDDSISRKHCTFLLSNNELRVVDDGSKYGTTVNSDKNKLSKNPVPLKAGDKIHFGCFENIWEICWKKNVTMVSKRKLDTEEIASNENSLSSSNVSKKQKENPVDKFDIVIGSSDDEHPITSSRRSARHRKNVIYSEDVNESPPKKSINEKNTRSKKISQKVSEVSERNRVVCDSDEDLFATSTQNQNSSEQCESSSSGIRKFTLESSGDLIDFNISKMRGNARKRPSCEPENTDIKKKVPRVETNSRNQSNQNISNLSLAVEPAATTSSSQKIVKQPSKKPEKEPTSLISRKRDNEDDVFAFAVSTKRAQKRTRQNEKEENSSNDVTDSLPSSSTSVVKEKSSCTFKTSNICNKELFSSFDYNIDDDSGSWLSTKVSSIKVKDETHDETDESAMPSTFNESINYVAHVIRKSINLDTTLDSTKIFQKQKYQEPVESISLRKLNVNDMNLCLDENMV